MFRYGTKIHQNDDCPRVTTARCKRFSLPKLLEIVQRDGGNRGWSCSPSDGSSQINWCILGNQLLKAVSRLRVTLLEMEADLGITTLTEAEKTVLAAAVLAADRDGIFEISVLQSQSMVAQMSHSTFFRVIRTLGEKDLINRMTDEKRSLYRLKA